MMSEGVATAIPSACSKDPRLAVFGLFGGRNLGNEATLEAALTFLKRDTPEAKLSCICIVPDSVSRRYCLVASTMFAPHWRSPAARALNKLLLRWPSHVKNLLWARRGLRDVDILLVAGTGALDDFGSGPGGYPSLIFAWCLAARMLGVRVMFLSVGAGPIDHFVSRRLMRFAASTAIYRSYRDEVSKSFMQSIGLDTTADAVFPDVVFGLDLACSPEMSEPAKAKPTVGVGVMTYRGWRQERRKGDAIFATYLAKMTAFIGWLASQGCDIRLLMGEDSDKEAIDRISQGLDDQFGADVSAGVLFEPALTLRSLAGQIANTDVVVATRYHNVICALACFKPTISLGYAAKNDAIMNDMALGEFCQHIETFDLSRLKSQFQILVDRRRELASAMAARKRELDLRIEEQNAIAAKVIRSPRP